MSVTIAGEWRQVPTDEIRPQQIIGVGSQGELADVAEQQHRIWAKSVRLLAYGAWPRQVDLSSPLTTSYQEIAAGVCRIWSSSATRIRVHIYGADISVRAQVGGTATGAATVGTTALTWASSGIKTLTSLTRDGDGYATISIEALSSSGTPQLRYVAIEEVELLAVPDGSDSDTVFRRLDSDMLIADAPLTVLQMQALDDNARALRWQRSRGACHLYPGGVLSSRAHRLSSVHWRLDGPYMIECPPWTSAIDVALRVTPAAGPDMEILALTDQERFAEVVDRAVAITGGGSASTQTFTGLRARPGPVRVWVAFRSDIGSVDATYTIGGFAGPATIYSKDITVYAPYPSDYCGVSEEDAEWSGGSKNGLLSPAAGAAYDLAAVLGVDSAGSVANDVGECRSRISPHIGTREGPTAAFFDPTYSRDSSAGTTQVNFAPQISVRDLGRLDLGGVWVEARGPEASRRKRVLPDDLARASVIQGAARATSELASYTTPVWQLRHAGHRNTETVSVLTGTTYQPEGHYLFLARAAANDTLTVPIYLPLDPDLGESAGLLTGGVVRAQLLLEIFRTAAYGADSSSSQGADLELGFSGATRLRRDDYQVRSRAPRTGARVTLADAGQAVKCESYDSGTDVYHEFAYTQQYTWPGDHLASAPIWQLTPIVETVVASWPSIPDLELTAYGPQGIGIAIAGMRIWSAPRR